MTLLKLLSNVGGADLSFRREDYCVAVALIALPEGRQVLAVERTYREGICAILDPTQQEVDVARNRDLWELWNSERAVRLQSGVQRNSLKEVAGFTPWSTMTDMAEVNVHRPLPSLLRVAGVREPIPFPASADGRCGPRP